ncbi:MAG: choice-of-anchor tandem repeat GloVer-containing protein [Isosphaeraceae bacterium]
MKVLAKASKFARLAAAVALAALSHHPAAQAQITFTSVFSFNGLNGSGPMAGVVQGPDGALYGTTTQGGNSALGTVFRFDRAAATVSTLHHFSGADGSTLYSGVTVGKDGLLYGSTYSGGAANLGTLFRLGTDGVNFSTLTEFTGGVDGANPDDLGFVVAPDGTLFGTTSTGGAAGGGTVFSVDPVTASVSTRYSFGAAAGVDAGLVAGRDGSWYGTTYTGGANSAGSVFRVDPATLAVTTLHEFSGPDGQNPVPGSLTQASDGYLYGTTQLGGNGTVYRLDPKTLAFQQIHVFSGTTDGRAPLGGLVESPDGYLYGTTVLGGQGYGTVYRVQLSTLAYGIVVRFGNSNGRSPSGNLVLAKDGALYGVTRLGGTYNAGTIYRLASADVTPPTITGIVATPSTLKPSGKLATVNLAVAATDDVDPAPVSKIISVSANQPITTSDWAITGALTVSLRARSTDRAARIYTITVQCTDASGNSSTGTVTVTVKKS